MKRPADAIVEISMRSRDDGGRGEVFSGYRPQHAIREDYQTSGEIEFLDRQMLQPGETALAKVWYLTPEAYPHCLWPGKQMELCEGARVVGTARIVEVCNPLLVADPPDSTG